MSDGEPPWLSVCVCVCIIHVACKLASCRLLRRNRREFGMHFFFPHSSQGSSQSPVSFYFHSSPGLQRPCLNTSVSLMCIRLNYTVRGVPPVHSWISTARVRLFFFFFPLSLCESIDASGCNAILNYWDLGNSLILLPSPKQIYIYF